MRNFVNASYTSVNTLCTQYSQKSLPIPVRIILKLPPRHVKGNNLFSSTIQGHHNIDEEINKLATATHVVRVLRCFSYVRGRPATTVARWTPTFVRKPCQRSTRAVGATQFARNNLSTLILILDFGHVQTNKQTAHGLRMVRLDVSYVFNKHIQIKF